MIDYPPEPDKRAAPFRNIPCEVYLLHKQINLLTVFREGCTLRAQLQVEAIGEGGFQKSGSHQVGATQEENRKQEEER